MDTAAVTAEPAWIEIDREVVLLTTDPAALSATVYDANGTPIEGLELTWSTTDDAVVTVDDTGQLSPGAVGSAQVTASIGGIEASPSLVMTADLAADAALYDDAQVLDLAIADGQSWGLGMTFELILSDADSVAVDDVLVPSGAMPLAGRVRAVEAVTEGHRFTAQVVPLAEMFDAFRLDETLAVDTRDYAVDTEVAAEWDITRDDEGWFSSTYRGNRSAVQGTRALTCWEDASSGGVAPSVSFEAHTLAIRPSLHLDVEADQQTFERAIIEASVETDLDLEITGQVAFEGKVACKHRMANFPLPVGALAAIWGPFIEAGVGLEFSGKVTLPNLGVRAKTQRTITGRVGLDCATGTCDVVAEGTLDGSGDDISLVWPGIDQTTFEPAVFAFAYADVKVGPSELARVFISRDSADALTWDFAGITAGLKQDATLRVKEGQQTDAAYRSRYGTTIELAVGRPFEKTWETNDGFWSFVGSQLGLTITKLELKETIDLFKSPSGTWSFASDTLAAGVVNTATLELVDVTYAGLDNVESVKIYRVGTDGTLTEEATLARSADGQTTYTWDYTPTQADVDAPPTFWAATSTTLGGPVVYELANNATEGFAPPPSNSVTNASVVLVVDPSLRTTHYLDETTNTVTDAQGSSPNSYAEQDTTLHFDGTSLTAVDFSAFVENTTGFDQGRSDLTLWITLDEEADWSVSATCAESISAGKADFQMWNYTPSTPTLVSALSPEDEGCPYSDAGTLSPGEYQLIFDARSGSSSYTGNARMDARFDLF